MTRLLNRHEEVTHTRLSQVCASHGAAVFAKVRLKDVLHVENSGIDSALYRFALQSHFDFVVTEELECRFAVEFDGPRHGTPQQQRRDQNKSDLCARFHFPLLRINARYLPKSYRGYDLLSWCVDQ